MIQDKDIEKLIQDHYGAPPEIKADAIDRIVKKATNTPPQNVYAFNIKEFAVAACLLLSICGGTFAGHIRQQTATNEANEQAILQAVENSLFTHNISELG